MKLTTNALPLIGLAVAYVAVFAGPVWFAARVVGAGDVSFSRSVVCLAVGTLGAIIGSSIGGLIGVIMVPIAFLLSFKFVLGASFVESVLLGVLSFVCAALMVHLFGQLVSP